jgi:GDP-4-dehydro-6-deoxy-D-mannose reductase
VAGLSLVTGATGFAGGHLLARLLENEPSVAAWSNPRGRSHESSDPRISWTAVDILDREAVARALDQLRPRAVYHLAGIADVGGTWQDPQRALNVNVLGTHYLIEGLRRAQLTCRVLITGSAHVYRQSTQAIDEDATIGPASPYGVSKLAQEMLARRAGTCPMIITRPFNHAGPGQSPAFAMSSFARQVAEIEAGVRPPVVRVGNLDARRDITDVRDVVRAYVQLMEHGQPERPYNICRGEAHRIGDLLDVLTGLARTRVEVRIDRDLVRPHDNPLFLGDPSRIAKEAGWRASIPIEQTLSDLLDDWRGRVSVRS